jgi:hypothetical protein
MRAMILHLFDRSAWAQPASVVAGTRVEGATLDSIPLVSVGSATTLVAVTSFAGVALLSVRMVDFEYASHRVGGHIR